MMTFDIYQKEENNILKQQYKIYKSKTHTDESFLKISGIQILCIFEQGNLISGFQTNFNKKINFP